MQNSENINLQARSYRLRNLASGVAILAIMLSGSALAQDPQWELMLENVGGPIAVDPYDSDVIYVARSGSGSIKSGVWKSTDGGQSWDFYSEGFSMDPLDMMINPHNPQEILISGHENITVQKSTDGGETWMQASKGISGSSHGTRGYQLAYDSRDSTWWVAQDAMMHGGIFRSKDGVHWEPSIDYPGLSLLIDEDNDVYYAGTGGLARLLRSTDRGQTWEEKFEGLSSRVHYLARVPGSSTLYAASRGIHKSYDQAETWFPVNDTLTEKASFEGGLLVSPADTNIIIAGARHVAIQGISAGIFISRDGGGSWQRYDSGLPRTDTTHIRSGHLYWDHSANILYATIRTSHGPNLYRLKNATGTGATPPDEPEPELPESIELYQNYPNPFNPQTVIEFALPATMDVTLQIYDVTGRVIETLLDQRMSAGRHQTTWDASELASGLYIYRISAGDFIQSRQMTLIR